MKRAKNAECKGLSILIGAFILRLFDSRFPLVYFSGLKYILKAQFTRVMFLTVIPRARMGSESIAHEAEGLMGC